MSLPGPRASVTAVLGPTNTGKTHFAIERLLSHPNGAVGFPLRLLARENYDRVVRLKGARHVALVTGEEKIVPAQGAVFPVHRRSDAARAPASTSSPSTRSRCAPIPSAAMSSPTGCSAPGRGGTMLLGADTMRPLIRKLVPDAEFVSRPRLSRLGYSGTRKLTRLPPRCAVIAFSAGRVYEIAELLRRQRGGAAIVLGALSPRTRNAQVAMYQARRGRLPGGHRRDRHGAQHAGRPRRLLRTQEVRRQAAPRARGLRARPDRGPGRAVT